MIERKILAENVGTRMIRNAVDTYGVAGVMEGIVEYIDEQKNEEYPFRSCQLTEAQRERIIKKIHSLTLWVGKMMLDGAFTDDEIREVRKY